MPQKATIPKFSMLSYNHTPRQIQVYRLFQNQYTTNFTGKQEQAQLSLCLLAIWYAETLPSRVNG